jgi:hypothetical protein
LAKSSCEWSPVWLRHKIEKKAVCTSYRMGYEGELTQVEVQPQRPSNGWYTGGAGSLWVFTK